MSARIHDRELLDRLEALPAAPFSGTAWRVARRGRDPLLGAAAGGRWSPADAGQVLYTSLEKEGALAEIHFRLSLEPVLPSRFELELHQLEIDLRQVVQISGMGELERLGVDARRYGTTQYERTHAVSAAAQFMEYEGMLVPSARSSTLNLVIFLDQLAADSTLSLLHSSAIDWSTFRPGG